MGEYRYNPPHSKSQHERKVGLKVARRVQMDAVVKRKICAPISL
jgi:hypothetical protein